VRVGIDGRALQGRRAGIGRYVFEICRELDTLLPEAEFFVYAAEPVELPINSTRWHLRLESRAWARALKPIAWLKLRAGRLCREDRLDVFWGTATLLPRLPSGVRRLATVYDLNFRIAPETMGPAHRFAHQLFFARDVRRAHRRLTISEGTADRLTAWLGPPRPAVIPPAASSVFHPRDPAAVARTLTALGIRPPYFLAVGTWEPRKNLELLVRVFRGLQAEGRFQQHRLVLAGGAGWKDARLRNLLQGSAADNSQSFPTIIPVGYVSDDQLAELYSGCTAFVFPSRYEGFGIPVLEARACGALVVTSDLPELREAGGENTIYFRPTPEGLRHALTGLNGRTTSPAKPAVSLPTWRESAALLARYLRED
jgi:glycosyltransferase involved in cell wall biosynthesis